MARIVLRGALLTAALMFPGTSWAEPVDFTDCDGYAPPTAKADSMTRGTWLWGLASSSSDIRPDELDFAPHRIAQCDQALADPLLKPDFLLRRINLLQAKSLHQIASNRAEEALATLYVAQAIIPPGPAHLHERGLGLSNRIIRAAALLELGRLEEGRAILAEIRTSRVYSSFLAIIVDGVEARRGVGIKSHLEALRRRAPVMPSAALMGLVISVTASDFRRAVEFGSGLTLELPHVRGGWTVEGATESDLIKTRADVAGCLAYSLAALGDADKAAETIESARQDIFEAATPPVLRPGQKQLSRSQETDYQQRKTFAEQAALRMVAWQKLIDLRGRVPSMQPAQVLAEMDKIKTESVMPVADLLSQIRVPQHEEADRTAAIAQFVGKIDEEQREVAALTLERLVRMLPRAETAGNQPKFKRAGDGYFLSDNGFSQRKMGSDDKWTVRFTNALASGVAVDELAVMSAAQLAKRQGYDGFVIEAHRNVERTVHMSSYYGATQDIPSGRETLLVVRLVRGTDLPADLKGAEWRVLNADDAIARISAEYPNVVQ